MAPLSETQGRASFVFATSTALSRPRRAASRDTDARFTSAIHAILSTLEVGPTPVSQIAVHPSLHYSSTQILRLGT